MSRFLIKIKYKGQEIDTYENVYGDSKEEATIKVFKYIVANMLDLETSEMVEKDNFNFDKFYNMCDEIFEKLDSLSGDQIYNLFSADKEKYSEELKIISNQGLSGLYDYIRKQTDKMEESHQYPFDYYELIMEKGEEI